MTTITVLLALTGLVGVAVAGSTLPADVEHALRTEKQLYLATRRADGTPSSKSPVWFMYDGDAVYFTTEPSTYKARRIAKGSDVLVWVGSETGPYFEGKGELLRDPAVAERMAPVYNQKYWIAWLGLFRPRPERVRDGKTLIVKVVPR